MRTWIYGEDQPWSLPNDAEGLDGYPSPKNICSKKLTQPPRLQIRLPLRALLNSPCYRVTTKSHFFRGQVQANDYREYNNYHSQADQNAAQLWVH
jgi:hypothetical protein